MTGDDFVGAVVLLTFVLVLVVSGILAAMPLRPRARSRGPKAPPPAPPAWRDHGSEREAAPLPKLSSWHGGDGNAGRLEYFADWGNTRRLTWAPSRCEYCGRRAAEGLAECLGCGAPSTSAAVQFVETDQPRRSPDRVQK